jgi:hypothetical protein
VNQRAISALLLLGLWACTPVLNWRQVTLDRLTALLPCKPDRAQRTVKLDQGEVALEMAGCEVGDALYAISHVQAKDTAAAQELIRQWQTVALGNLRATSPQTLLWEAPKGGGAAVRLAAAGRRSDGNVVEAQLAWFKANADVYHVAVYAQKLTPEQVDTLLSDLKIQ